MLKKPTYDELEQKVRELERTVQELKQEKQFTSGNKDLVDSVSRFENLVANIPGVVYQVKATKDHVYSAEFFNDKITEIFGLEKGPNPPFTEFYNRLPDDEKERFLHSVQEAVDRVEPWNYEGRFIRPDGETIWFSGTSISRVEGESVIFFGILMDITRRKQIESSLRLTQFCFDSAPVGIYHLQSDGRILNVNTHAASMLGYTVEEMAGFYLWDIDPNAHPDTFDDGWQNFISAGVTFFEVTHIRKDGSRYTAEITSKLLEYNDQKIVICFGQDITDRKKVEAEKEQMLKELQIALENVKTLSGLLPICSSCKKIRNDKGYWERIEAYFHEHTDVQLSHGICPDCMKKLYPEYAEWLKGCQ